MVSSGLLRRGALVRTDVSEEPGASFIRVTPIFVTQKTPFFIVTAVKTSNLIKVNLSLCLMTGTEQVKTQDIVALFMTLTLDGGEWSAARPGRFIPKEENPVILR
jgi:hypothetical protein